jgi:hypothetical protein
MLSEKARMRLGIPRLPLEDVLDTVIRTEAEPDRQVHARWQRRYPEYREALDDFFTRWGIADFEVGLYSPHQLAKTTVKRVLDEMRREGRIPSEDHAQPLEPFDRRVLAGVDELEGKGHLESITEKLSERTGARILPNSIAAALASLEKRSLIWSRAARPRAGFKQKGRQFFNVTLAGKRALRRIS